MNPSPRASCQVTRLIPVSNSRCVLIYLCHILHPRGPSYTLCTCLLSQFPHPSLLSSVFEIGLSHGVTKQRMCRACCVLSLDAMDKFLFHLPQRRAVQACEKRLSETAVQDRAGTRCNHGGEPHPNTSRAILCQACCPCIGYLRYRHPRDHLAGR